ncbi:MAG TPA: DUF305 domain-containing protein [Chloroflexota bacterium]|nr:DUF305 domain-containing protein [Chloroflexota bacterium]
MRRRTVAVIAGTAVFAVVPLAARGVALAQYGPMGYLRGPVGRGGGMGMGMGGMMGSGGAGMMGGMPMMDQVAADRWFIEEMIPHHEDAVVMANLALAQAEHAELKALAQQIKATQTKEIADMRTWYRAWFGAAEVPPGAMDQMHDAMGPMMDMMMGRMMGGVPQTRDAMHADPRSIDGARPFDRAFIEHMIPHHQMAVMMATHALAAAERPELQALLQSIITGQSAEIRQMQTWYRAWYGTG